MVVTQNLTSSGNNGSGARILNGSKLTVGLDTTFENNTVDGLFLSNGSTFISGQSVFTSNNGVIGIFIDSSNFTSTGSITQIPMEIWVFLCIKQM